jgi:hypothetical protein
MMRVMLRQTAQFLLPKSIASPALFRAVATVAWLVIGAIRSDLAKRRGESDALSDIQAGEFHYRLRGKLGASDRLAIQIAEQEYGIHMVRTGGCVVDDGPDCAYDFAYNKVMQDHFQMRFGDDPIRQAISAARAEWERRYG